ncbi:hypothetical protein AB0O34_08025 [Sphaerisporangium sp. NPDC088356]|uniref:hypothetical protein n=1 Tax=Sphaerisporangium sp. NPDC088356 TaxID=3154871 RepID=UPI00341FC5EB
METGVFKVTDAEPVVSSGPLKPVKIGFEPVYESVDTVDNSFGLGPLAGSRPGVEGMGEEYRLDEPRAVRVHHTSPDMS